ncbi:hypothetical protein LTR04_005321 [Oleoguttula sp. CCFEE 6159]|nr:hypothetical protein LTR04_005321 [Oleoguttula sp. CCFEE 6159]
MNCQKCRTPLRLDGSLEDLNPASFKILADSAQQQNPKVSRPSRPAYSQDERERYNRASQNAQSPVFKRSIPSAHTRKERAKDNPAAMSYVLLTDSQVTPRPEAQATIPESPRKGRRRSVGTKTGDVDDNTLLSHKMETTAHLFEILSSRSDIDHPICVECTEILVEGLQKRLATASKERDAYVEFLKEANNDIPTEEERQQAQNDLAIVHEREQKAFQELEKLEAERVAMDEELSALQAEARQLDIEEEAFWQERNAFTTTLSSFQNTRDSMSVQLSHASQRLEALQRTNVYNDTFCIGHDGNFGTINGLRLGRLSHLPVEWSEINAAWGQALLLLAVVAEKLDYEFQGYVLHPLGSASTIDKLEYPQQASTNDPTHPAKPKVSHFDLYCAGDLPLGLGFLHRRFDSAMVAFLDCLRQLGQHVERTSGAGAGGGPGLNMPYQISKDKIGDASIKLGGFSQEEMWTKACKYALTCCKFLLAHASHVVSNDTGAGAKSEAVDRRGVSR